MAGGSKRGREADREKDGKTTSKSGQDEEVSERHLRTDSGLQREQNTTQQG
jgi:hypothetical protein